MEFYQKYLEEAENKKLYKTDKGFIVYKFRSRYNLLLEIIWISPEYRTSTAAMEFAGDLFYTLGGANFDMYGEVDECHPNKTRMLSHYFQMGFEVDEMKPSKVIIKMPREKVLENYNNYLESLNR